jgi:NADH-quinone oxidoreductase subunit L
VIEVVHLSTTPGAYYAYWCVLLGVFVTALYSFRMFFVVFHGEERIDPHAKKTLKESPAVITVPLIMLAIPSVVIGWFTIGPVLFGEFFIDSIFVLHDPGVVAQLGQEFHGPLLFIAHAATSSIALYLALAGTLTAWFFYLKRPDLPGRLQKRFALLYEVLDNKYYFDWFNEIVISKNIRLLARSFWRIGDEVLIDGIMVNGTAQTIGFFSRLIRTFQSGYLYHYAFAMIIGLAVILGWLVFGY